MTKTNALPSAITESSESRVSRERWNGRALEWLMTLVVVLLLVVLMLLLREDEQRAGLIEAPRQSDGSLADKADSLLPLSDTPAKGAEIVSAPESFEAMTEIVRPLSPAAPKHPHWGSAVLRAGIIRRIAEMMMDKFVLRLISHRQQLLHIQNQASRQVAYLDARLASIQKRMEERIAVYEKHIAQLKQQLALKQAAERERTATRPTE